MPVCEPTCQHSLHNSLSNPIETCRETEWVLRIFHLCDQVTGSGCSFPRIYKAIRSLNCCLIETDSTQTTLLVPTPTQTYLTHTLQPSGDSTPADNLYCETSRYPVSASSDPNKHTSICYTAHIPSNIPSATGLQKLEPSSWQGTSAEVSPTREGC